ncbi:MAG: hypothetical protein ACXVGH_12005 [Mycobacteriales bacterium]
MAVLVWPVLGVLAVVVALVLLGRRSGGRPTRDVLRRTGFVLALVTFVLGALLVGGEALTDPGGWAGLGVTAAWAVPLLAVGVLVRTRPQLAVTVLAAGVAATVLLGLWYAVAPDGWRGLENDLGPARAIAVFALGAALGLLALRRTRAAGVLLLVLGVVPALLAEAGSRRATSSMLAAAATPVLVGLLYLVSSLLPAPRRAHVGGHARRSVPTG